MNTPDPALVFNNALYNASNKERQRLLLTLIDEAERYAQEGVCYADLLSALDVGAVNGYMAFTNQQVTLAADFSGMSRITFAKKCEQSRKRVDGKLAVLSTSAEAAAQGGVPYQMLVTALDMGAIPGYMRQAGNKVKDAVKIAKMSFYQFTNKKRRVLKEHPSNKKGKSRYENAHS